MEKLPDHSHSVTRSAFSFFSGTALSRISGLARDISIAYVFGTNASIAAFLVALRLANLLRRIFGEGALLNSFIPHFESYRKGTPKQGAIFFRDSFMSIFTILALLIAFIESLIYFFPGWFGATKETFLIVQLIAIILPGVLFICLFSLCSGLLHCEKHYFLTGISPVAFNVIWIASVWILRNHMPDSAVIGLSIGIAIAFFSQWLLTMPTTIAILLKSLTLRELVKCRIFTQEIRTMMSSLSISVISVTATQINTAIDTIFARFTSLEGPAYLNYAIHVQQLPLALIGISISSALLPPLSRAVHSDNFLQYKSLLEFSVSAAMFIIIPCSIGIFTVGEACINLIFGRGHFDNISIYHTTLCLWSYGVGLVPMVISLLLIPAFHAKKDYYTPFKASLSSILVNFILNILFVLVFQFGPESLAMSTSIAAYLNAWILYRNMSQKIGATVSSAFLYSMLQILMGSIFAGAIAVLVGYFFLNDQTIPTILGSIGQYTQNFSGQALEFSCLFVVFSVSFFSFMIITRNKEILKIIKTILRTS